MNAMVVWTNNLKKKNDSLSTFMPFKGSCLQIISFIMRFDFQKYSSPVSLVKKMSKELDSYEFYRYLYSTTQVLQLHVFVRAFLEQ